MQHLKRALMKLIVNIKFILKNKDSFQQNIVATFTSSNNYSYKENSHKLHLLRLEN